MRCLDAALEGLVRTYALRASELATSVVVESERDLLRSLLAFVRDGVGGERFVAYPEVIEAFAARFGKRITLGGTGLRAALAMDKLGVASTVHLVSIDDHMRRLLPRGVSYVGSARRDSTRPHLVVQFTEGSTVRAKDIDLRAPRSNRIIYVNDPANAELVLDEDLGQALSAADVFLISAFNSISEKGTLRARLHAGRGTCAPCHRPRSSSTRMPGSTCPHSAPWYGRRCSTARTSTA